MTRRRQCNLLTLTEPHGTEKHSYRHLPPIMPYTDERVASALRALKLLPRCIIVGDGVYASYADVYYHDGSKITLGSLVLGALERSHRLYALALARDIVKRQCGVECTATAICFGVSGVHCVPLPAPYLDEAKRQLQ